MGLGLKGKGHIYSKSAMWGIYRALFRIYGSLFESICGSFDVFDSQVLCVGGLICVCVCV